MWYPPPTSSRSSPDNVAPSYRNCTSVGAGTVGPEETSNLACRELESGGRGGGGGGGERKGRGGGREERGGGGGEGRRGGGGERKGRGGGGEGGERGRGGERYLMCHEEMGEHVMC